MCEDDLSYCELRSKEVVNATDGKRMGRIVDILFSRSDGIISGIVVPFARRSVFSKNQDIFIPWRCVQKIGEDVILVNLVMEADGRMSCNHKEPPPPPPKHCHDGNKCDSKPSRRGKECEEPHPDCDFRCEKCMLFDCAHRWSQTN